MAEEVDAERQAFMDELGMAYVEQPGPRSAVACPTACRLQLQPFVTVI